MSGKLKGHEVTCETYIRTFMKTNKEYLERMKTVLFSK